MSPSAQPKTTSPIHGTHLADLMADAALFHKLLCSHVYRKLSFYSVASRKSLDTDGYILTVIGIATKRIVLVYLYRGGVEREVD